MTTSLLKKAEDELQILRVRMRKIADFIHNEAIPYDIRLNLARDLHLSTPEK